MNKTLPYIISFCYSFFLDFVIRLDSFGKRMAENSKQSKEKAAMVTTMMATLWSSSSATRIPPSQTIKTAYNWCTFPLKLEP